MKDNDKYQEYEWQFTGFILTDKGKYRSIRKPYSLNFGNGATLTIKQKRDNEVSGSLKISKSETKDVLMKYIDQINILSKLIDEM